MKLANFDTRDRVLIVAEIGNNHEGDFDTAVRLVDEAQAAGADAVKFQTFRTDFYVSKNDRDRFERLKRFELCYADFEKLAFHAKSKGLLFLSTPFDLESAHFLSGIAQGLKIASGDNNFFPLIDQVIDKGLPVIVSTGLTDGVQIEKIIDHVRASAPDLIKAGRLALLHCVSSYPVNPEEADLRAIEYIREQFPDVTVGYSDHTQGIEAGVLSVALGARIIEKHFTLDKNYSDFRDHRLSADPAELKVMVERIRLAEKLVGQKRKIVQPSETPSLASLRRSIVAGADLHTGHELALEDLTWIRPGGGMAPGSERQIIGKKLNRDVAFGEVLCAEDVS